uniref:G_PROTEIN_RECEP_F1_2 domain-containing protein n=1 Tax=Panagrellus redivivus TaxID=6233 RepID=A0A7E4VTL9_PANRE
MLLTSQPQGDHIPVLMFVEFVAEIIMNCVIVVLALWVITKVPFRNDFHINLRISIINIYLVLPIIAVVRTILIIDVFADNRLPVFLTSVAERLFFWAQTALWFMQMPSMVERICATIFYRSYLHWSARGTSAVVMLCWVSSILTALEIIKVTPSDMYIKTGGGTLFILFVYIVIFCLTWKHYKNRKNLQNLNERYQIFQNVQTLYPLLWTIAIELIHNVATMIEVIIYVFVILPKNDLVEYQILFGITNVVRECLLIGYCIPFFYFSPNRRRVQFINKMTAEAQNSNKLYFKQLERQW